jgi:hypothetical protein
MTYTVCQLDCRAAREAILDLWRRNLPETTPDRFGWLYETGPASGFLLRSGRQEAVGAAGLMRRTFYAFGDRVEAGQAIDLNVDPEHRTIGPALALQRAVLAAVASGGIDLAYGFPNPQSEAVLRRAGYETLGDLGRWVKPLSCRAALDRWSWPRPLSRGVAAAIDPILRLASPETSSRRPLGIRLERLDASDPRLDALWQQARAALPILGERTSEYLRWRFGRCPGVSYHAMGLSQAGGKLVGYVVYGRRGAAVHVADFLVADARHLDPLLAEFLHRMRRENADLVVVLYLGNSAVCKTLARFGFWRRPSGRRAMVYVAPRRLAPHHVQLLNAENWHLTGADIDTDA